MPKNSPCVGNIMYIFINLLIVINLFGYNYAGDSNEDSDEEDYKACEEYYIALDEEIMSK